MEIHLPKGLRELCDLDTLKLESASFVDENLRALHSDILWSVKTREGEGYIYVVIEHQSREDIIDQLVVLLVTECANDSQITALLNYILLTGDEARFKKFISELTRRMPQHRERIMTIAERIHNDGWLLGREKGKEEGEQRLLRLLLQNGADPEWIQKITGLSAEQMQALEQPLPESKRDPWIEY